jgi:hypothetical protein
LSQALIAIDGEARSVHKTNKPVHSEDDAHSVGSGLTRQQLKKSCGFSTIETMGGSYGLDTIAGFGDVLVCIGISGVDENVRRAA